MFCRAAILKENNYFKSSDTLHCEDYELWTRLLNKGIELSNIENPLQKIRVNSESVSRKFESIQITNFIKLVQQHHSRMSNVQIDQETAMVLCLRLNKEVHINHLRNAFKIQSKLTKKYLSKANIIERKEILTINDKKNNPEAKIEKKCETSPIIKKISRC